MSNKIRVLYSIPNFDTAGSGKVVYDLVNGLNREKFEIEIACNHNKGAFFKVVEALGVPIHLFNTSTHYRPYNSLYNRIRNISLFFKKRNYDIIHSWHWSSDWTEVLAARMAGIPFVYTKKAMSWGSNHWKIKSYLSNFIVTINEDMYQYFPYKKSQKLIPLGIDTEFYSPHLFSKQNEKTEYFEIITVANLVPVKGIEVLLNALTLLNDFSIRLTILGDDDNDYGRELKRICKNFQLERQVFFLGKSLDVRQNIVHSDLYVIPTLNSGRKEGMPMALVEAMSMAIPVLGSNISGVNFVLKDFKNLLFEAGNVADLADHISEMKSRSIKGRIEIGQNLREYCQKNYAMKLFIDSHEKLYIELAR